MARHFLVSIATTFPDILAVADTSQGSWEPLQVTSDCRTLQFILKDVE